MGALNPPDIGPSARALRYDFTGNCDYAWGKLSPEPSTTAARASRDDVLRSTVALTNVVVTPVRGRTE